MTKEVTYRGIVNFIIIFSIAFFVSCNPTEDLPPDNFTTSSKYGKIQLEFPIDDTNVPQRCIKRADLSISYTADSLYKKEYVTVVNVSSYKNLYEAILKPGGYYYQAAKVCICGGDTCLWGGYPGGQNGIKWTMSSFEIIKDEISYDRITFD